MKKGKSEKDKELEAELFKKLEGQRAEEQKQQMEQNGLGVVLERPIIFFDIETTGLEIVSNKIVQICVAKIFPDFTNKVITRLINPEIPIPEEASKIHHIYDKDVVDKPTFKQIAKSMFDFFSGCDVAGFNLNHFDIPFLAEEFARCGYLFPDKGTKSLDVFRMYQKAEPRTLATAAKKYLDIDFSEDAHDAEKDVEVTTRIFIEMMRREEVLKSLTFDEINELSKRHPKQAETTAKLIYDEQGYLVYNFGRAQGVRVVDDTSFAEWIQMKAIGFAMSIKLLIQAELKKHFHTGNKKR